MAAITMPFSTKKGLFPTLPDELLLDIFRANIPNPASSMDTIKSYIATGVNQRTREIALDVFQRNFTSEIVLDIHCHAGRSRWHNPFLLSAGVEDSPLTGYVRNAVPRVKCLHSRFERETVEENMRMLRELCDKMSQLMEVEVEFLSDDDEKAFDGEVLESVRLTVERDLPHLKVTTTPAVEGHGVSAVERFRAVVAASTWRTGTEGWQRLETYDKAQYSDTDDSSEDGDGEDGENPWKKRKVWR